MPYPRPYRPGPPPLLPGGEQKYLLDELQTLRERFDEVLDMLPISTTTAPVRPREGMIRKSMNPWRPVVGQVTDKWVIYNGTAWEYLDV